MRSQEKQILPSLSPRLLVPNRNPHPKELSFSMPDDFNLELSFITATVLGVLSLFLSRYFRSDPMVRRPVHVLSSVTFKVITERHYTSAAQRYPNHRVF